MNNLNVRYDRRADVLYVTTALNGPAKAREDDNGIVWRYLDADGTLVGATIIDFQEIWHSRLADLVNEVASHFHVSKGSAARALESVDG